MRPNQLEAEIDSFYEIKEVLAYQRILNQLQEERLKETKAPKPKKK